MAKTPGCTSRGLNPIGPHSKKSARSPLASTSQTSVRFPRSAASTANAAAIVDLPTPPLPVTNSRRRSRRSATRSSGRSEADAARLAGRADLDVGHLAGRHAVATSLAIGEPQDLVLVGERRLDV